MEQRFSDFFRSLRTVCSTAPPVAKPARDIFLGSEVEYDPSGDLTYPRFMVAGSFAGVMEHVCMYPVDTVKMRMQAASSESPQYRGTAHALSSIARSEGIRALYRGVGAVALGAIPSHAVYFGTIEYTRRLLGSDETAHHPLKNALSGAAATLAHDAVVNPVDIIKQRLQMYASPYGSMLQVAREIMQKEGFRAFYASYPATVLMNVPFYAVNVATYESTKLFLTGPTGEHGAVQEAVAGGVAGGLGGLLSNPLDVIKTRIQVNNPGMVRPKFGVVAREILQQHGYRGFMLGATARVVFYVPSAAICWTSYETAKRVLRKL